MVSVTTTLKRSLAGIPGARHFTPIADAILGSKYDLSVAYIGKTRSQTLNHTHRKKNRPTNILSFPLSDTDGEILLTLPLLDVQAKKAGVKLRDHILYVFIHGCLHLKGHTHGDTMDRQEQHVCTVFDVPYPHGS